MPERSLVTKTLCLKGQRDRFGPSLELPAARGVVYVGRPMFQGGWRLAGSPFANPFRVQRTGSAEKAVALFREYLRERPELVERARVELRGMTLGCWCPRGSACHALELARVADGGQP